MELDMDAVKESYRKLERASQNLNTVSDALNTVVETINAKLKVLNLGISFWHTWANTDSGGNAVGYARVNGKWGLAIKKFKSADAARRERYEEEVWLMQDAPRWMRIEAIGLLPDLLETGVERTDEMCRKVMAAQEKVEQIVTGLGMGLGRDDAAS